MRYEITTITGKRDRAGTNAKVEVRLVGNSGATDFTRLGTTFRDEFQPGKTDTFTLPDCPDVGVVLLVEFITNGGDWFLDDVHVRDGQALRRFPYFGWVVRGQVARLLPGRACLRFEEESPVLVQARADQLEQRKGIYQWAPGRGLPDHVAVQDPVAMPLDERFTGARESMNAAETRLTKLNGLTVTASTLFDPFDQPDDAYKLYPVLPRPLLAAKPAPGEKPAHQSDEEFGWQCLAGVAPNHLRRVVSIPLKFRVDSARLAPHLRGAPLEGRLFLLDYALLEDIPLYSAPGQQRHCPASLCLLHLGADDCLRPIAVQLGQNGAKDPVFTPADPGWELAKVYVKCGEANIHQIETHALRTHLSMEPYLVATMRTLPTPHPLYKLLHRHLYGTLEINAQARQLLLGRGGVFDEFIATGGPSQGHIKMAAEAFATWTLASNALPADLAARGFDVSDLRMYPYAEDALCLWHAIRAYVDATLRPFYPTPAHLTGDDELQAWLAELRVHAHLGVDRGETVDDLVEIATTIIFTVSAQHAAVNFPQYEHFGFIPNAPGALRTPMPTGVVSVQSWMAALPDRNQSLRQMSVAYLLSRRSEDEEYLLPKDGAGWREQLFVEAAPIGAIETFHQALRDLRDEIAQRNLQRPRPYPWLSPDQVPASVAI